LLYAGATVVLLAVVPVREGRTREAGVRRSDVPRLAALAHPRRRRFDDIEAILEIARQGAHSGSAICNARLQAVL
jgi:hypothetical protein